MAQTEETRKALIRDNFKCMWCLHHLDRLRNVFENVKNYHPFGGGGHHIFGRSRVDYEIAIVGLCAEHHYNVENAHGEPTKDQLIDLMLEVYGYDLRKLWSQYIKPKG